MEGCKSLQCLKSESKSTKSGSKIKKSSKKGEVNGKNYSSGKKISNKKTAKKVHDKPE